MSAAVHTAQNDLSVPRASSYARIPAAFRLQFSVPTALIGVPALVFVAAWLIALGIVVWIHYAADRGAEAASEPIYTGASQAALWCLAFMAAYVASHTFPFSMALSYSRRVFVIGAFLAFAAVSAGYGAAFGLAAGLERLTDGYGIHMYNFDLPYLTEGPGGIFAAALFAAALCLFVMMFGFFWSILYRRVSLGVLWTVLLAVLVALLLVAMLITQAGEWPAVWQWMGEQNSLTLTGWMLPPALGLAVVNYGVIRRATPA